MFECSIEGLLLKRLVECLKDMCADASFVCKADGISLIAMDGSHVAVVNLNLDLDLFHKYRCDRPVELGLSIPNLLLALQPVKTAETLVHLSSLHGADADEEDDVVLHVNIEEPGTGDSWSMELRLLDIEAEPLTVPQEEHEAVAVVSSKELQDLIRYLNSFCESVVVRMEKSCMKLSARGDSLAASRKLHVDNMTCSAATEQEFAARYLNIFMKGAALSDSVEIACSRGQPMRVLFALGLHADGEREGGKRKGGGGGSDKLHHRDVKMEEDGNGVAGGSNRSSFLAFYLAPRLDEAEE